MDIIQKDWKRYKQVPLSPEEKDIMVCSKCNNTWTMYMHEVKWNWLEWQSSLWISWKQCSCWRIPPVLQY